MKTAIFFFILFPLMIFAQENLAPSSFSQEGKKFTFINILNAQYSLNFKESEVLIESELEFEAIQDGYPLFDLVSDDIQTISFNSISLNIQDVYPPSSDSDKMRFIPLTVSKGKKQNIKISHRIKYSDKLPELIKNKNSIEFYFKFCDGKGVRQLLERYLPTNLQFDQYKSTFTILFDPQFKKQKIISNGTVTQISPNHLKIDFPSFYNSASYFFHTFPGNLYSIYQLRYKDIDFSFYFAKSNKTFEVKFLQEKFFISNLKSIIDELEIDYGKFPYPKMIIYMGENFSGIEHAGATRTSRYSLGHELFHMYFGRSAMPADGRSAWIDEGLARWRDGGSWQERIVNYLSRTSDKYRQYPSLPPLFKGFKGNSEYLRTTYNYSTQVDPYTNGALLFGHIDYILKGDLRSFLKEFHSEYKHQLFTSENFFDSLFCFIEDHHGDNELKIIMDLYEKYVRPSR